MSKINEKNPKKTAVEKPETSIDVLAVVKGINERMTKVGEGSIETGEYILDKVFQGSLGDAFSRNPYKDRSMRQIADHPKLLVDRRTLGTCVKVASLRRNLITSKAACSNLRYSHFVVLLKVMDEKKRRKLAEEASRLRLSVRDLTEKLRGTKQAGNTVERAKELKRKVEDPLSLLKDEKARKLLENPKELAKQLKSADRLLIAKAIDDVVDKMVTSTDLLKRVRRNIAQIELGDMKTAA